MDGNSIDKNIEIIKLKIKESCLRSNRDLNDVKIIGVVKKQSLDNIKKGIELGIINLGINYLKDFEILKPNLNDNFVNWHYIGQIQSNKVKNIVGHVCLIHSVDRIKIASKIGECATKLGITQDILIEINLDGETTKAGVKLDQVEQFLQDVTQIQGIRVCGIMGMPSLKSNIEETNLSFKNVYESILKWSKIIKKPHHLSQISLGTTNDFGSAVEFGSTMIRLGTGLYGNRDYN